MSSSTKKPPKRFHFIDNTDITSAGQNSTQVRRHVMQEYMREKRWQARARVDSNDDYEISVRSRQEKLAQLPRTRTRQRQPKKQLAGHGDLSSTAMEPFSRAKSQGNDSQRRWPSDFVQNPRCDFPERRAKGHLQRPGFHLDTTAFAKLFDLMQDQQRHPAKRPSMLPWTSLSCGSWVRAARFLQPQSMLSAARTDPFDSLPVTLDHEDEQLFDFYATVMPACSYGLDKPNAQNWFLSVFIPEAMSGALCFENTILTHAASTKDRMSGVDQSRSTIERRIRASQRLLDHHRQFPGDTSNTTISATLFAAALEFLDSSTEQQKLGWMYWSTALQKIRERGGPSELVQHKRLQMLVNWCDYTFPGCHPYSVDINFHTDNMEAMAIARAEVSEQCTEFITFLKCTEQLALVQAGMQRNPISKSRQQIRFSTFLPGQPLHALLTPADASNYSESCRYRQIMSRLAILMTINITIWEYRHSPELSEKFFLELVENVAHNGFARHASVEALLQILISGSRHSSLQHAERPWFVGRMLQIAKRLSRPSFDRLNKLLFSCTTLGTDVKPIMENWQNDLRTEILSSPIVSCYSRFTRETI
ncbi:hypothetical protein H2204_002655 [Knufia peltigerae]|uniref:Tachykinin family protein n=1 Tax=Knufia peltigerae TaxID=1002370 RepID=A0AA38YAF9_9EURO|nr:hypothetical protein H2204_002655 [Knufia peltigerae]